MKHVLRPRSGRTGDGARSWPYLAAAILLLASLAIRWPGVAMYDSVSQYEQALSGDYADWHPPILARLWGLTLRLWPGTAPMLLLQMLAWWGGLGLLAGALARNGRGRAAAAILAVGAVPLFLGWATVVLKDAQMAACLVAATGLVAQWRLDGRRLPAGAIAGVIVLLAYTTLVRGNALFASVPMAFALAGWCGVRRPISRAALLVVTLGAVIAATPFVNHRLLGAEPSQVERSPPLYDLAGIAHFAPLPTIPGLAPGQWREAERRGCYTPYFWNPYGEPAQCDFVGEALAFGPRAGRGPMRTWLTLIVAHPLAYAEHRLGHLNANLRFLVGAGEPDAIPPVGSEPNIVGLGAPPTRMGGWLIVAAGWLVATPLGWPIVWLTLAGMLLWASPRAATAQVALGRMLAFSAAIMSASFAVVSLASDLRYHLWSMVATALAAILLVDARALAPRRWRIGLGAVALVIVGGIVARVVLPPFHVPYPAYVPSPR